MHQKVDEAEEEDDGSWSVEDSHQITLMPGMFVILDVEEFAAVTNAEAVHVTEEGQVFVLDNRTGRLRNLADPPPILGKLTTVKP